MKLFLFFFLHASFFVLPNILPTATANSKIDSLLSLLNKNKQDSIQIIYLNALFNEYRQIGKNDSAIHYANASLALGKKLNSPNAIATSYNYLGVTFRDQGNYVKALENSFNALNTYKEMLEQSIQSKKTGEIGKINSLIASMFKNIGLVYSDQSDYTKALEYYFNALKITEEIGDKKEFAKTISNIGGVYHRQSNYSKAMECYLKALKIQEELKNKYGIALNLGNIGIIYSDKGDYSKAMEYYLKALKINQELDNKHAIAINLGNIGNCYKEQNNLPKALEFSFKALKMREELGAKELMATTLDNIGVIYTQQKKYSNAEEYLFRALSLAKEINSLWRSKEVYQNLSLLFFLKREYKNAYDYHQQYGIVKDSIFNAESSEQIAEMQTKYETEKKEQQIKLLNKDKEIQTKDLQRQKTIRNAVAVFLLLVIVFLFVLINRFVLIRKQKKVIESEREKSEKLLLNILPKATAEELKLNNKVIPKSYEMVTVMFTDFKGFTTFAEKMSAEELVNELDFIFKKFDEIISKYHIEKIKTIGDAYMCAEGLPIANTTNPFDIVMAALEIQQFMQEQNKWQLRIGVHTGPVIAGVVGDKKFAYDIWGDAVNTASRMESSGEAGKVNISESTYQLVKDNFNCLYRGEVEAKNKGKIKMYFIERKTI